MDPISAFVEDNKLTFGRYVKEFTEWLTDNFHREFRAFSDGLAWVIEGAIDLLSAVPPILLIVLLAGSPIGCIEASSWWLAS